jgi:hypothetical protein
MSIKNDNNSINLLAHGTAPTPSPKAETEQEPEPEPPDRNSNPGAEQPEIKP